MTKIDNEKIKEIELNILIAIDSFCRENKLCYSLCAGTLLGAVRHKGFIPWDDDIDIMMCRLDYEKFINTFEKSNNSKYNIVTFKNSKNYYYMFSKVSASNTFLKDSVAKEIEHLGAFVDIFPIDNLGDTYKDAKNTIKDFRLKKYICVSSCWKKFYINGKGFFYQIARMLIYTASKFVDCKKICFQMEKSIKYLDKDNYVGMIFGAYGYKEIFKKKFFENYIEIEFEKHFFMSIKYYDEYLTKLYGDYKQLPPLDKQKTHHTFSIFYR